MGTSDRGCEWSLITQLAQEGVVRELMQKMIEARIMTESM
jgi:hypothetical protein